MAEQIAASVFLVVLVVVLVWLLAVGLKDENGTPTE